MSDPVITLTTDFGNDSPYVAAMKGVILGINPSARILDLNHKIPPQGIRASAFFLANAIPYFPAGVIHVVVVDPGVGTTRALLYIEVNGHRLLAPDNGCWTALIHEAAPRVIRLEEARFWRQSVSATFHGRDILAPVAGHLSLGVEATSLGPMSADWVRLETPEVRTGMNCLLGEVVFIDRFGNLITNIPPVPQEPNVLILGKASRCRFRWVKTYGDAKPGTLVALISSAGTVEIAVTQGNAARRLNAQIGTPITVGWKR